MLDESFNGATATLIFPGREHLEKAVAGGTFYEFHDGAFVIFVLAEDHGCTLCWARGHREENLGGESFDRFLVFPTLEDALAALSKVEAHLANCLDTEEVASDSAATHAASNPKLS